MLTIGQYFFGKDMGKNLWLTFFGPPCSLLYDCQK